jgi:hypothetical protein
MPQSRASPPRRSGALGASPYLGWAVPRHLALASIAIAVAALAGPPAAALAQPPATPADQLVDRIVAVVDEDPILLSDLEEVIGLGLAERQEGERDDAFRARVLDGLIDQRLRFHEVDRFGFAQVPVEEIEGRVAEIRGRFASAAEFAAKLREVGLTEEEVRQLVARQSMVLTYVDERLGARVFVSLDDIRAYHRDVLAPKLAALGQPVPPLETVREEIRTLLKEQRLNEEIARWTEELRLEADVQNFLGEQDAPPPVVQRFDAPKPR